MRIEIDGRRNSDCSGIGLVDTGGGPIRFIPSAVEVDLLPVGPAGGPGADGCQEQAAGRPDLRPEVVDPLQGETLRWARTEDDRIVFYRFSDRRNGRVFAGPIHPEKTAKGTGRCLHRLRAGPQRRSRCARRWNGKGTEAMRGRRGGSARGLGDGDCGATLIVDWSAAMADDPRSDFYGVWVGEAVSRNLKNGEEEERDITAVFQKHRRGGFQVDRIAVILVDGKRAVPGVKRRVTEQVFSPAEDGTSCGDPETEPVQGSRGNAGHRRRRRALGQPGRQSPADLFLRGPGRRPFRSCRPWTPPSTATGWKSASSGSWTARSSSIWKAPRSASTKGGPSPNRAPSSRRRRQAYDR